MLLQVSLRLLCQPAKSPISTTSQRLSRCVSMHLEKIALHSWKVRREGLVTHTNFPECASLWFLHVAICGMFKTNPFWAAFDVLILLSAIAKAGTNILLTYIAACPQVISEIVYLDLGLFVGSKRKRKRVWFQQFAHALNCHGIPWSPHTYFRPFVKHNLYITRSTVHRFIMVAYIMQRINCIVCI